MDSPINNTSHTEANQIDQTVVNQFRMIIAIVMIILIIFMAFFIYNLIKCYMPKWNNDDQKEENAETRNINNENRKIEFEEI